MIKDRAKKTSEAEKLLSSFARGKLQKKGRILSENGRLEMIAENGRVGISGNSLLT